MAKPKRHYLVVECSNCKRYLLAPSGNKTRTCPYCEKRQVVENLRVAAHSENAEEARILLQELKIQGRRDKPSSANSER